MKNIFKKIIDPINFVVIFILFIMSILAMYKYMDYTYNRVKSFIVVFYLLPGLLFFTIFSIFNFIRFKNTKNLYTKLITLVPLLVIVIYLLYIAFFIITF